MAAPVLHELSVPPDAKTQGGHEILRAFVINSGLSIAVQRAFDDPSLWGRFLADVARYVAGLYERETGISADVALAQIREMLASELGAGNSGPLS